MQQDGLRGFLVQTPKNFSEETIKWNSHLCQARLRGYLFVKTIKYIEGDLYEGEIDAVGQACGEGVLIMKTGATLTGTWK